MDTAVDRGEARSIAEALENVDAFSKGLDAEAARYWSLHRRRFQSVLEFVENRLGDASDFRILDIGNSFQTVALKEAFPRLAVDTFGYFDHRFVAGEESQHYEFDLNDAYFADRWPELKGEGYDLILFLEVIEHLYTSPVQVLSCLKRLLKPGGEILIQTPNAAALKKRLRLLSGKNPYELIREDRGNPGHFREYTVRDLKRYAKLTGFTVEDVRMDSFLIDGKRFDRVCDRLSRYLPGPLKCGISMALKLAD